MKDYITQVAEALYQSGQIDSSVHAQLIEEADNPWATVSYDDCNHALLIGEGSKAIQVRLSSIATLLKELYLATKEERGV